jgi:hypothetical protein
MSAAKVTGKPVVRTPGRLDDNSKTFNIRARRGPNSRSVPLASGQ